MKINITIIILMLFSGSSFAQINGYTVSGDPVILFSDGTWKYVRPDLISASGKITDPQLLETANRKNLIGRWKATRLKMFNDKTAKIDIVDLTDPKSIKHFTDTVWYDGLYGRLLRDTSSAAKKGMKDAAAYFDGLQSSFLSFNTDSTYSLDNQPLLFGFVANSIMAKKLSGKKWDYSGKVQMISLELAKGDYRVYVIVKQTDQLLIIDERSRDGKDYPVKEITFIRQ